MEIDLDEPTRTQIAAIFGVSSRWIGELRAKGEMPADGATMRENVEAWVARNMPDQADEDGAALNLDYERARVAKEQADSKAMDNAERRKELASLPHMTGAVLGLITLAVSRLQQVPALVAKGDHRLRVKIETAITDALEELSVTRVEEAIGGGFDDDEADAADDSD